MLLLEHLVQERLLLPKDAHQIEERLLARVSARGEWKHLGRKQPA
jgi:hypothetical protein